MSRNYLGIFVLVLTSLACGTAAATAPAGPRPTPYQDCNSDAVDNWLSSQTSLLQESQAGWDQFDANPANALGVAVAAESRYRRSLAVFTPDCMKDVAQNQTDSFYEEWQFFLAVSRDDLLAAGLHMERMDELFNESEAQFGGDWFDREVIPRLDR